MGQVTGIPALDIQVSIETVTDTSHEQRDSFVVALSKQIVRDISSVSAQGTE